MIQVNLIPDVKKELTHARYIRSRIILFSIITSIVAISVLLVLALYSYGFQTVRNASLDTKIEQESTKFFAVEDLSKMLTIQKQLETISSLNEGKKINSRFNDMINKINPVAPNTVLYNSISIDSEEQTISIEGQTTGYPSYETFKKTLQNAVVKYTNEGSDEELTKALASKISIAETSFGIDSDGNQVLRFTIKFEYAEEFLSPLAKGAVVIVQNTGDVTDSYQGVPQSLFVDRAVDIMGVR